MQFPGESLSRRPLPGGGGKSVEGQHATVLIQCDRCATRLLLFEQISRTLTNMRSWGAEIHVEAHHPHLAYAQCCNCGAATSFDRRLLPSAALPSPPVLAPSSFSRTGPDSLQAG